MTEEAYFERMACLKALNSGMQTLTDLRKIYPQAYEWDRNSEKLVFKVDANVPLDKRQQVLHRGNIFHSIYAVHTGTEGNGCLGHWMAKTLHKESQMPKQHE
ncbi:hypothetical protein ACHAWO_002533 [Cyclotella atomus]|uniref:Uncharacterized protein n=1 Tax=Cyclotella atomus TaxID=382360 RepID=A0ABD3QVL2_9STRA